MSDLVRDTTERTGAGMSIMYGGLLGALFLPGFGLISAVPVGALVMLVLRYVEWPERLRTWISEHRALVTLAGFLLSFAVWPVGSDAVERGFGGALAAFVLASVMGAARSARPDQNVGAIMGVLIGGAFGGPIRAVLGGAVGAAIGLLMRRQSGLATGLVIGICLAATMMTPSCAGYGIDLTTTRTSAYEQWSDYMSQAAFEAEDRGTAMSVWDMSSGPSEFADREEFSFAGFIFAWFCGLPLSALFGLMLGQLAKARAVPTVPVPTSFSSPPAQPASPPES